MLRLAEAARIEAFHLTLWGSFANACLPTGRLRMTVIDGGF
jgi:hypothetical protein